MINEILNNKSMGLRDGLPIGIGYFAISFAFGIMAVSYGFGIHEAFLISALNLTSAGQMAALPIIARGGSFIELGLTQLLINLRYSLMSISLSQKLDPGTRTADKLYLALNVTDEMYAVSIGKDQPLGKKYMLSLLLLPYLGWTLGTLLGAVAGNILPALIVTALGISMYAMFIAIVVPVARTSRPVLAAVIISIALSCSFKYLPLLNKVPDGFVIIICALAASLIMAAVAPIKEDDGDEQL